LITLACLGFFTSRAKHQKLYKTFIALCRISYRSEVRRLLQ
jgi:hypothetical protein